ncbi:hypothetical protein [Streptomyces sp. SID13031]|uniref:hypothetical protein n=1 Tax=Streptomyces sp. SID13031 TaxID=2706046 RepID=UPI0013CDD138|nr:hypothetical protein [Streptomyces sp. SID13031]NEA35469.1 hypothetical protein [Streptomyces sp. SID13031]
MPASLPVRAVRKARRIVRGRRRVHEVLDSPSRAVERILSPHYPEHLVAEPDVEPEAETEEAPAVDAGRPDARHELASATRVVGVLTGATARRLGDVLAVTVVAPGSRALGTRVESGDVLVVERAALQSGPWSTAETSSGTALLREVLEWTTEARDCGAPVIMLDSADAPNVGTNLLRGASDVVLPRAQQADPVLGPVPMSPVVSLLDTVARAAVEGDR